MLLGIDDDAVGVDALSLHVDGDGTDGRDADQEIRPLDLAVQGLGLCGSDAYVAQNELCRGSC